MHDSFFRREILFLFISALSAYYLTGLLFQDSTSRPVTLAVTIVSFIVIYYLITYAYGMIGKRKG